MAAVQTANPPTFESVWAALQELTASQKETDRIIRENAERSDQRQEKTDKILGKLGKRMGEVIEYMVAPNLREKFREIGYDFPSATQNSDVSDRTNNIHLEIDIKLENGDKALLIEVKTKLSTEDVQDHIERLGKMRTYADLHGDKRTFLGAVASVVMSENVRDFALKQGFFVIEPSGETFNIISPKDQPKEW